MKSYRAGQLYSFAPSKDNKRARRDSPERPPGVHTMILEDLPKYTIFYITNENATLVRNDDHATAPPFLHLNSNSNVSYPKPDGTTHVGPFEVMKAAYGDEFAVQHVVETKLDGEWKINTDTVDAVYPKRGAPKPCGTIRSAEWTTKMPRTETLAVVWRPYQDGSVEIADPCNPGFTRKIPKAKLSDMRGYNMQPAAKLMFIWVEHALQEDGTLYDRHKELFFVKHLSSVPDYKLFAARKYVKQVIGGRAITRDELKAIQSKYKSGRPLDEVAKLQLLAINASMAYLFTKRVDNVATRRVIGEPEMRTTQHDHIRDLIIRAPVSDENAAEALKTFRKGAAAKLLPLHNKELRLPEVKIDIGGSELDKEATDLKPGTKMLVVTFPVDADTVEAVWQMEIEELQSIVLKLEIPPARVTTAEFQSFLPTQTFYMLVTEPNPGAEWDRSKGDIVRLLLNYPVLAHHSWAVDYENAERVKSRRGFELNKGQSTAVYRMQDVEKQAGVIVAPAGAGKTVVAAIGATEIVQNDETGTARVFITSPLNYAVAAAANETVLEAIGPDGAPLFPMLALQSNNYLAGRGADDTYHHCRLPVLLSKLQQERIQYLNQKEQETANAAVKACTAQFTTLSDVEYSQMEPDEQDDANAKETEDPIRAGLKLLLEKLQPRVILGTTAMFERYAEELKDYVTHVIMDEAGTGAQHNVLSIVHFLRKIRKLVLIGDPLQLHNHVTDVDLVLRAYGFESALDSALNNRDVERTQLTVTHRFHSKLREFLSVFYGPLEGGVDDSQRDAFLKCGFPFPNQEAPIMAVNFWSKAVQTDEKSYTNRGQQDAAVEIAKIIRRLAPHLSLAIMSMYKSEADELRKRKLLPDDVTIESVDKLQGQERDIAILLTTRTLTQEEFELDDHGASKMAHAGDPRRLLVALSRARQGVVFVGDFPSLSRAPAWVQVLQKTHQMTAPVDREYIRKLELHTAQKILAVHQQVMSPASAAAHAMENLVVVSPGPQPSTNDQPNVAVATIPLPPIVPVAPIFAQVRTDAASASPIAPQQAAETLPALPIAPVLVPTVAVTPMNQDSNIDASKDPNPLPPAGLPPSATYASTVATTSSARKPHGDPADNDATTKAAAKAAAALAKPRKARSKKH